MKKQSKIILLLTILFLFLNSCQTTSIQRKNVLSVFLSEDRILATLNIKSLKGNLKAEFMEEAKKVNPHFVQLLKRTNYVFVSLSKDSKDMDIALTGNLPKVGVSIIAKKLKWKKYQLKIPLEGKYSPIFDIGNGIKMMALKNNLYIVSKNIELFLKNYEKSNKTYEITPRIQTVMNDVEQEFLYLNYKEASLTSLLFKSFMQSFISDKINLGFSFDLFYYNSPFKNNEDKTIFKERVILSMKNKNVAKAVFKLINIALKANDNPSFKTIKVELSSNKILLKHTKFLKSYKDIFAFMPNKF